VCLSIINESQDWKPSLTLTQVLMGIQEWLNNPNPDSPAQDDAYRVFTRNKDAYEQRVRAQARRFAAV
jgi:ubiquitin-conjugating enzyme E2 I